MLLELLLCRLALIGLTPRERQPTKRLVTEFANGMRTYEVLDTPEKEQEAIRKVAALSPLRVYSRGSPDKNNPPEPGGDQGGTRRYPHG